MPRPLKLGPKEAKGRPGLLRGREGGEAEEGRGTAINGKQPSFTKGYTH